MLITDDFVMLNFPKTGSTFAREAIKQIYTKRESRIRKQLSKLGLYKPSVIELMMPHIDDNTSVIDQHGTLRQIPVEHRNKPIVSIFRNPYSRYESTFFFRWWQQYPPTDMDTIREHYPNFPDLSFSEYYEMINVFGAQSRLHGIVPKIELGILSIQFIQFYFNDPESVLMKIDDDYIESRQFEKDMGNIHFIHMENLKEELIEYLLHIGIPQHQAASISSMEKLNVTERKNGEMKHQDDLINADIEKRILEREKLLFTIFPIYKRHQSVSAK